VGDTAATHPVVLRGGSVSGADHRTRWELLGWVVALATQSGAHLTDYVVERGTVDFYGGAEAARLLKQAVEAGYLIPTRLEGRPAWKIVDEPDLFHLRLKAEVEWDRYHRRTVNDPAIRGPVMLRDGSVCRRCGRTVKLADRRGTRGFTIDFVRPGQRDAGPDDLTVACRGCNSARGRAQAAGQLAEWDAANPLLPPPARPYFEPDAIDYLTQHGFTVPAVGNDPEARPAHHAGDGDRPGSQPGHGPSRERPTSPPQSRSKNVKPEGNGTVKPTSSEGYGSGKPGSGRVGTGRDGPGRGGSGGAQRRRRRRR
jgi:5-methylcytosine-specific restriction endonuclease McrA